MAVQRRAFLASLAVIPFPALASMLRHHHAAITPHRVRQLIAEERAQFEYIGTIPGYFPRWFWYRDRLNPLTGYLTGHETEALALSAIDNTVAARVLNRLSVDLASRDDIALWLKGLPAETIIAEILSRDAAALC